MSGPHGARCSGAGVLLSHVAEPRSLVLGIGRLDEDDGPRIPLIGDRAKTKASGGPFQVLLALSADAFPKCKVAAARPPISERSEESWKYDALYQYWTGNDSHAGKSELSAGDYAGDAGSGHNGRSLSAA